eukprot:scaffold35328_cov30-Tisochrysis_lutea.AAC.4
MPVSTSSCHLNEYFASPSPMMCRLCLTSQSVKSLSQMARRPHPIHSSLAFHPCLKPLYRRFSLLLVSEWGLALEILPAPCPTQGSMAEITYMAPPLPRPRPIPLRMRSSPSPPHRR